MQVFNFLHIFHKYGLFGNYDPKTVGMTGMPSDLANVKKEHTNMTATERSPNRNFPYLKTMGTKPWENKSYCVSSRAVTKIWRNILIKLCPSDQQNFLEAEEKSTEKSLILKKQLINGQPLILL